MKQSLVVLGATLAMAFTAHRTVAEPAAKKPSASSAKEVKTEEVPAEDAFEELEPVADGEVTEQVKKLESEPKGQDATAPVEKDEKAAAESEPVKPPGWIEGQVNDKLGLAVSFGWARLRGPGNWHAGGASDLQASYKLLDVGPMGKTLFVTLRYTPIAAHVRYQSKSYIGVVQGLAPGVRWIFDYKPKWQVTSTADLGYYFVKVRGLDATSSPSALKGGKAVLGLAGGMSRIIDNKFLWGGRLSLGVGQLTVIQLGTEFTFLF